MNEKDSFAVSLWDIGADLEEKITLDLVYSLKILNVQESKLSRWCIGERLSHTLILVKR